MSYRPTAPRHLAVVERAAEEFPTEFREVQREGLPQGRREAFIKIVGRRLFEIDRRFGLNGKRGTSTLSQDAVSFKTPASPAGGVEVIDVIFAAGSDEASPAWTDVTQQTANAGHIGMWIQPPLEVPPPPPTPNRKNKFQYFREDLTPFFRGDVPAHQMFDELITRVRTEAGLEIKEENWPAYRALAFWRYGNQTLIRSERARSHDSAIVFSPNAEGYIDLETQLLALWKRDDPTPDPDPATPLPSLLKMAKRDRVGNFLYPKADYFPPAAPSKGEAAFRSWCRWTQQHGDKLILLNAEQKDWGRDRGNPSYTGPQQFPGGFLRDDRIEVFIRFLQIAHAEYGLFPVVGLFEQNSIQDRNWSDIERKAKTYIPRLNPWVVAFWDTWEVNEVAGVDDHHRLEDIIDEHATKPHGLHFTSFKSESPWYNQDGSAVDYWARNKSRVVWMQYGFNTEIDKIQFRTGQLRKILDEAGKRQEVVMAEGSIWGPNVWMDGPGHSLDEAAQRGKAGMNGGAIARMNG